MVKHLVMFKLADEAEGNNKRENARIIKTKLEDLKSVIPVIKKIVVNINDEKASQDNYDIVLDSEFNTMEDLNAYIVHPEHRKVGEFIVKVKTERAAVDYEF